MRRRWSHPSRRLLRRWLDEGDERLDAHIHRCSRCAAKLEEIGDTSVPIADGLRSALAPPDDLHVRLRTGLAQRLQAQEDVQLLAELMGLPWQTVRALGTGPTEADH